MSHFDPAVLALLLAGSMALNFVLALWLIQVRRPQRPRAAECVTCGYDLRATVDGRCPECGTPFVAEAAGPPRVTHCSFCGRSNRETGQMAEGPGDVFICWLCAERCHGMILESRRAAASDPPDDASYHARG